MACISIASDVVSVCADLQLLAQAAKRSLQVRERLLDFLNTGAQLVCIDSEGLTAGPAGELRIAFELSDGLRGLAAAVRAGEFDDLAVEHVHGCPSQKVV